MYLNGKKLVEIASQLNLPEGTVRRWKSTYKWGSERSLNKSERSQRRKGGQPGNRNAVGHGGTGPPGNKNAVKTGEFETLFFDALEPEEMRLIGMVQPDKEQLLLQEIQLLTVRERRMLKRIDSLRELEECAPEEEDDEPGVISTKVPPGMTVTKYTAGFEKGKITDLREFTGILGQIQAVEEALTRVQARRQRAIEALHKFGYDDAHLELIKAQVDKLNREGQDDDGEEGVEIYNDAPKEAD
ncbi:terminase [Blautia producta]|uniref:Terminase n=3 Tax=Blautia producta TaxID=33035 RepID=A0A7G5N3A6_9FIRM|nr:terminase [Blautia producta ATCC 27340 = DSM 2950]QMW81349.1 terminase [Blautia producta]